MTPLVQSSPFGTALPDIDSYHANETGNPLTDAFSTSTTVHPGGKATPVAEEEIAATYASLTQKSRHGKTAAYIHVPFCESHCLYCGFYRKRYDEGQSRAYADALIAELRAGAESPLQASAPIHAVYIGGGTPTSLEAPDLKRILDAIRENLPLANDCELTVEGRIWNFGPEKMEACLEGGANRFSIGVQTFDTKLRQSMHRLADRDTVLTALARLRDYDQAAVIIDLIYGFPNQTMELWEEDIRIFQGLGLDGVDLYQLKVFPGTPLSKAIDKGRFPPGADLATRARMYARGTELMADAQYTRLSVNHWGRTPRERNIYNHMMKSPSCCLPFGPGAGGSAHGHFFFLETDYDVWRRAVLDDGRKPLVTMQRQTAHAELEKTITSELELCRINLGDLGKRFGLPLAETLGTLYEQWKRAGLLTHRNGWCRLTTAGQFWQVTMAQLTINYLYDTIFTEES